MSLNDGRQQRRGETTFGSRADAFCQEIPHVPALSVILAQKNRTGGPAQVQQNPRKRPYAGLVNCIHLFGNRSYLKSNPDPFVFPPLFSPAHGS
jgi:hypothetical protein